MLTLRRCRLLLLVALTHGCGGEAFSGGDASPASAAGSGGLGGSGGSGGAGGQVLPAGSSGAGGAAAAAGGGGAAGGPSGGAAGAAGSAGGAAGAAGSAGGGAACEGAEITSDPLNCGKCGHSCLGGECVSGMCQPKLLGSVDGNHTSIAIDASGIFFSDLNVSTTAPGTGAVWAMPKEGGSPTPLVAPGNAQPIGLALRGDSVFFTDLTGALGKVPKAGGASTLTPTGSPGAAGVAVGEGVVYWCAGDSIFATTSTSDPRLVAGHVSAVDLVADKNALFWTVGGQPGHGAVQTTTLPLPSAGESKVETLAMGLPGAGDLAEDADSLYWVSLGDDRIMRIAKSGGEPELVAESSPDSPGVTSLAVDDKHVYWMTSGPLIGGGFKNNGSVRRARKADKHLEVLASNLNNGLGRIALDGPAIYWTAYWFGGVYRLAK